MDKKASTGNPEMHEIRLLDFAIQIGLFLALIVILKEAGITLIVSFFGFYFWLTFCFSRRKNNLGREMKFVGDIDRLTFEMIGKVGLMLVNQVGNYYIYGSRNRIMPNVKYVVRDYGKFCIVIIPAVQFCNIENLLDLKPIDNREEAK